MPRGEIVVSETAIEPREQSIQQATADALARLDAGETIFNKKIAMLGNCRKAAIAATRPEDWVLFKDKDSNVSGMICGEGAAKVAPFYGIRCDNFRPVKDGLFSPVKEVGTDGDEISYTGACDAWSEFINLPAEELTLTRSTREHFRGREGQGELIERGDIRSAIRTGLLTKAVRKLAGMQSVPEDELAEAWGGRQHLDRCRKGSGFGSSTERTAIRVADDGIEDKRNELGNAVLRVVGGDRDTARKLLKEITSGTGKDGKEFSGFDSVARITQRWQVSKAWDKLKAHELWTEPDNV